MPRVPLTWLGEYVSIPENASAQSVADALVRVGLEEESIEGPPVSGPLVVGKVLTMESEPQKNGKTINWCYVDVGSHGVELPDGQRGRGIVCGAHNFAVGDLVVVALPGTTLPGPFPIASRKTYGHISDGMICSARELGLGDDHEGIIVLSAIGIDEEHGYTAASLVPGADAIELLGLGDSVVEINVTPDRGYCFAIRGVAREYSHATGAAFSDPAALETPAATDGGYEVRIEDEAPIRGKKGCDRFALRVIRNVAASAPSPLWMQRRLLQAGMRPISLAVDVTNYVMLELGQPMHAYDLSVVDGPIVVRRAHAGEIAHTLDGQHRPLNLEDLLITDSGAGSPSSRVLGIAGVMGGAESEISTTTTDLLLEAAHFDSVTVARTSRRHRLVSEASRRFERGVDPALPPAAIERAVQLLITYGGGTADAAVTDRDERVPLPPVHMGRDVPRRLVGVDYTDADVERVLTEIGCAVDTSDPHETVVTAPSWRPDLTEPVDLVEEIARLEGYDAIPSILPRAGSGRGLTQEQRLNRSMIRSLAERGYVEVLSYPFTSRAVFENFGYPADDERRNAVGILNPLSDEQPILRTEILQTLLETVRRNLGRGTTDLSLFEQGLVYRSGSRESHAPIPGVNRRPSDSELSEIASAIPEQPRHLAVVVTGDRELGGWWGPAREADYSDPISVVFVCARLAHVEVRVDGDAPAPWHPGRSATFVAHDGTVVGYAGELHPQVLRDLELPPRMSAAEIDMEKLTARSPLIVPANDISSYPVAKEDIALVVPEATLAEDVLRVIRDAGAPTIESVRLFDVYRGPQVGDDKKSLAFSLRLRAPDRTLTAQDTADVRDAIVRKAERAFGASLRS